MDSVYDGSLLSLEGVSIGDKDCLSQVESFIPESLALETFEEQELVIVEYVTQYSKLVGVSCDGEVGKLLEAFGIIIANIEGNGKAMGEALEEGVVVEAHTGKKDMREFNNLNTLVNYEGHSGCSLKDRCKGRVFK